MIFVALAAYNEENNIGALLDGIKRIADIHKISMCVVVVNDGSKDRTAEVVESRKPGLSINLITQPNAGFLKALERALRKTLEIASDNDICVTMDADNTHPAEIITKLVAGIDSGLDVVIASRFQAGGKMIGVPFHRVLMSEGAKVVMKLLVPIRNVRDYSTACRAYRVGVLREAFAAYPETLLEGRGFSGMAGFLIRLSQITDRMGEIPFVLRYDLKKGASSMNVWKTFRGYIEIIIGNFRGKYRRPA